MTISIITGGQTGVDTGTLYAAMKRAPATPWLALFPAGFKREQPADKWLREHSECLATADYAARTREVVRRASACLVIQPPGMSTPGTDLTVRLARDEGLQLWLFSEVADKSCWGAESCALAYWLRQLERTYGDLTLMVAGPRATKWPEGDETALAIMNATLDHRARLADEDRRRVTRPNRARKEGK